MAEIALQDVEKYFGDVYVIRKGSVTMAQAVGELEGMGYVERRPNPNDRRSRLVFLT